MEIVAAVLSYCLAYHDLEGSFPNSVCWMIALHAQVQLFDSAGERLLPAPHPEIDPIGPWPGGSRAANSLELRHKGEFRTLYERASAQFGPTFHYDLDLLCRFVPAPLWRVLSSMIDEGPGDANRRLKLIVDQESQRMIPATKALPVRRQAVTSVKGKRDAFRAVMSAVVELNRAGYPGDALSGWHRLPKAPGVSGVRADTDQSAIPLMNQRADWRRRQADVDGRLRRVAGESEADALARLPKSELDKALFRALGERVMVLIVDVLAVRPVVFTLIRLRDYDSHRLHDGEYHPAIAVRGHKGTAEDDRAWKVLPIECRPILETYLAFLKRYYSEVKTLPAARVVLDRRSEGALLFAFLTQPGKPYNKGSLSTKFSGARPSDKRTQVRPLVSKHPDAEGLERFDGYKAGQFRHAGLQNIAHLGVRYLREIGEEQWSPMVMGEALVDHREITGDKLGYYDLNQVRGRELLAAHAAKVSWEGLTGDRGARFGPDVALFRELDDRRRVVEAELELVREDLVALHRRHADGEASHHLTASFVGAYGEQADITSALARIDLRMERLTNPRRYVVLPDDAPKGAEQLDLDALVRQLDDEAETVTTITLDLQRRSVSVSEFANALAPYSSHPSVRRWVLGQLRHPTGDPRNPWEANGVPISGKGRKRVLWLDGIKETFWAGYPQAVRDRIVELLRLPGPKSWAAHQFGPLAPPSHVTLGAVDLSAFAKASGFGRAGDASRVPEATPQKGRSSNSSSADGVASG